MPGKHHLHVVSCYLILVFTSNFVSFLLMRIWGIHLWYCFCCQALTLFIFNSKERFCTPQAMTTSLVCCVHIYIYIHIYTVLVYM